MTTELLGHSSDWWNGVMLMALGLAAFAAVFVVIATAGVIITQRREAIAATRALEHYKSEAGTKIAEARTAGDVAKAEAGHANERAAKLENENLLLRREFSPRRIGPEQHRALVAALSKLHGTINIESMSDSESGLYAADILRTFTDAGWTIGTKEFPLGEIWHGLIFEDTTDPNTVAVLKAFLAAGIKDCRVAKRGKPSVTILVGGKPPPF